jgi:hypothetical protein
VGGGPSGIGGGAAGAPALGGGATGAGPPPLTPVGPEAPGECAAGGGAGASVGTAGGGVGGWAAGGAPSGVCGGIGWAVAAFVASDIARWNSVIGCCPAGAAGLAGVGMLGEGVPGGLEIGLDGRLGPRPGDEVPVEAPGDVNGPAAGTPMPGAGAPGVDCSTGTGGPAVCGEVTPWGLFSTTAGWLGGGGAAVGREVVPSGLFSAMALWSCGGRTTSADVVSPSELLLGLKNKFACVEAGPPVGLAPGREEPGPETDDVEVGCGGTVTLRSCSRAPSGGFHPSNEGTSRAAALTTPLFRL